MNLSESPLPVAVVTIDGPTASGKGTVARAVAAALQFHLLDSGAIYRAFALAVLNRRIAPDQLPALEALAKSLMLEFRGEAVWLDGIDVTDAIRAEAVGMLACSLSAIAEVRSALLARQRDFAKAPGLIADGRDMGTVVFPDAALKIYLTTSSDVRAKRRHGQLHKQPKQLVPHPLPDIAAKHMIEKGNGATIAGSLENFADVLNKIQQRDAQDKNRATAPLKPARDAIVIDNAAQGPQQTIDAVLALWSLRSQ